ncbi:MAG: hypothetical protein OQJ89_05825 [Kangiellaceae bacterium]|nr:hypothetical protein [Kangiellaceae bacterium]MCW9000640.1 hypothetical protein [Kangiellaceae bacterium]MCW9016460.1 hypothetical protein [Kangiellaceae bacterium]
MRIFVLILGCLFSLNSFAGISLSQAIVHFEDDGKTSEDIEVFNQGNETLYIKVEASQILFPGTDKQQREIYRDPRSAGLLVTPQRMVIASGARKRIRFVRLHSSSEQQTDKVYRVLVKPEVGDVSSTQTAVKVIVAYEVLVLAQPKDPKFNLVHQFNGNQLVVTNKGNTNVLLQTGNQCPKGQSVDDENNQCQEINGKRLYAGNSWAFELPYETPVSFRYSIGMENDVITFEPEQQK